MENELIVIKQLPIIEERLKLIQAEIQSKTEAALAMPCTEDTIKQVKAIRAELNRDFTDLETRRMEVKKKVLAPYEQFEAVYRQCVTDMFKPADFELKSKITAVEDGLRQQKREEVEAYYLEYQQSRGIDFPSFADAGIEVTLSASKKSLKDKAKVLIDRVAEDLEYITTLPDAPLVLAEYRQSMNLAQAINAVAKQRQAEETERKRLERLAQANQEQAAVVEQVEAVIQTQAPTSPPVELPPEPTVGEAASPREKLYTVTFTVRGTLEKLKELKAYLNEGGYDYE